MWCRSSVMTPPRMSGGTFLTSPTAAQMCVWRGNAAVGTAAVTTSSANVPYHSAFSLFATHATPGQYRHPTRSCCVHVPRAGNVLYPRQEHYEDAPQAIGNRRRRGLYASVRDGRRLHPCKGGHRVRLALLNLVTFCQRSTTVNRLRFDGSDTESEPSPAKRPKNSNDAQAAHKLKQPRKRAATPQRSPRQRQVWVGCLFPALPRTATHPPTLHRPHLFFHSQPPLPRSQPSLPLHQELTFTDSEVQAALGGASIVAHFNAFTSEFSAALKSHHQPH